MQRDERWSIFGSTESFEVFCKDAVPQLYVKPIAHKDIHDSFRVIRKLLEHSYYEYEFYDVAALKAILTLEMALKLRYQEINKSRTEKTLYPLITWFHQRHYLEVYNNEFLIGLKQLRDYLAHPDDNSYSGPMKRQVILTCLNLINDLYEDPKLRRERIGLITQINKFLFRIKKEGIKLQHQNESHLIFEAWPAFVNNKLSPLQIYFYLKPTFEIPENFFEEKGKLYNSPTFLITVSAFEFEKDILTFKDEKNLIYTISKIPTEKEQKEFNNWSKLFETYSNLTAERFSLNSYMTRTFLAHLNDFHKIN